MDRKPVTALDNSSVDRKNILNNPYALEYLQGEVGIKTTKFENDYILTSKQIAKFFEIDEKTIDRYIAKYSKELSQNGYQVLRGERLQKLKDTLRDIDVPKNTPRLGIFNFRAFINIAMLLVESEKAKVLRALILDIVIDVLSKKAGGSTKYINQRDEDFIIAQYAGENYKKDLTDALRDYVDMGNIKYAIYPNKIYMSIFKEHGADYKNILKLSKKENLRDTMYSEVLTTISMYETGFASVLKEEYAKAGRKLTSEEVDQFFQEFEKDPIWKPQIEMVRRKMASRDYGLRYITHNELRDYINPLDTPEFERFLGEKSKELAERVKEYQDVFKRLKDK